MSDTPTPRTDARQLADCQRHSNEALEFAYEHARELEREVAELREKTTKEYAKLTPEEIDDIWDFDNRHLMHKVAKALV